MQVVCVIKWVSEQVDKIATKRIDSFISQIEPA